MLAIVVNGRSGGACAVVLNIVLVACVSAQLYMYLKQILKSAYTHHPVSTVSFLLYLLLVVLLHKHGVHWLIITTTYIYYVFIGNTFM